MDRTGVSTVLFVSLLTFQSGDNHVVGYNAHLNGAHVGLQSAPVFQLTKLAPVAALTPTVLASSSSSFRQIYSGSYYPYPGYPPSYTGYPQYGQYGSYPIYAQYPAVPQYGVAASTVPSTVPVTSQQPIFTNQQVPPNSTMSKLPPVLEGFVLRIQNLLSTYNPENHVQLKKPHHTPYGWLPSNHIYTTLGVAPLQPIVPSIVTGTLQPVPATFETTPQHPIPTPIGTTPQQPIPPFFGTTPQQPIPPFFGTTPEQPIPTPFGTSPAQPIPTMVGISPEQPVPTDIGVVDTQEPIATQRPEQVAPVATTTPSALPSENKVNQVGVVPAMPNIPATVDTVRPPPNTVGLPNYPASMSPNLNPVTQPNNNPGNTNNNNGGNNMNGRPRPPKSKVPQDNANRPGTVPQQKPPGGQPPTPPQGSNWNNNNNNNPNSNLQPRPVQPLPGSNKSPSVPEVNYPSITEYGVPDLEAKNPGSNFNQVGLQRPPTSIPIGTVWKRPSNHVLPASPQNKVFTQYGAPDPFRVPQGQSGLSTQERNLIALIQQYGISLTQDQGNREPLDSYSNPGGGSYGVVPANSLPEKSGRSYHYDQPSVPFRYPLKQGN